MNNQQRPGALTGEEETLLIPLYSKAAESRRTDPILVDRKAEEIVDQLNRLDYDFTGLDIPRKTSATLSIRATKLDEYTRNFLAKHPDGVVIHLGCGLDSRCIRVGADETTWYDLDLPVVIELRRKFYQETDTYHMLQSSVTDLTWIMEIPERDHPVLVIAEGLFMYLREKDVKALISTLQATFPQCELVFDAYSELAARRVRMHPSLKKTGATVRWGMNDPSAIEQWGEHIRLKEEWYFTQSEDIPKLGPLFRLLFGIAGLFTTAKRSHRILAYNLSGESA